MARSNRQSIAALRRVIDTMGADIVLQLSEPLPRGRSERAGHRATIDDRITGCTACPISANACGPIPPWWASYRTPREGGVAVLGEAPNVKEAEHGELGHGRPQSILRSELTRNGIDDYTLLNTVQCAPLNSDGTTTREPSGRERDMCRSHVMAALDAADVEYILLVGGRALNSWRKDLRLSDVAGGAYIWNRRWIVYPIYHPNAVLRKDAQIEMVQWRRQLQRFGEIVAAGHRLEAMGTRCVGCGDAMFGWDEDGVPWCGACFERGARGALGGEVGRKQKNPNQGAML